MNEYSTDLFSNFRLTPLCLSASFACVFTSFIKLKQNLKPEIGNITSSFLIIQKFQEKFINKNLISTKFCSFHATSRTASQMSHTNFKIVVFFKISYECLKFVFTFFAHPFILVQHIIMCL